MRIWLVVVGLHDDACGPASPPRGPGVIGLVSRAEPPALLSRQRQDGPASGAGRSFRPCCSSLVVLSFANFDALCAGSTRRCRSLAPDADGSRSGATPERVIRDFPLTGSGAGTFGTAIGPYQTALPGFSIGQRAQSLPADWRRKAALLVSAPVRARAGVLPATIPLGAWR